MDFSAMLAALNQASGFELYRLRVAMDQVLDDPKWSVAVRSQLVLGQQVEYFNARRNGPSQGQVVEFRRKEVVVRELATGELWRLPYVAINVEGADVRIRENPVEGLSPRALAVGDRVGFVDQNQRQRSGRIERLNDKTVTLLCEGQKWRVSYALLHRVVEAEVEVDVAGAPTPGVGGPEKLRGA